MKVAEAVFRVNIGDVAHPQGVGGHGDIVLYQIPVLVEPVVGVRRMPWPWALQDKTERAQEAEEAVTSRNPAVGIYPAYHEP